jgi:hypothetical protein
MTTKCFLYRCQPASTEDFHRFLEQRDKGSAYQRVLVDIENRLRQVLRAHWATPLRSIPLEERDAWIAGPGKPILAAWTGSDAYKDWATRLRDAAHQAVRDARAAAVAGGLYWGTYLLIEESVEMAKRTTKGFSDLSYRRNSRIGVQIQISRPIRAEELVGGTDTRLRLGAERYAVPNMPAPNQYPPRAVGELRNRAGRVRPPRHCLASLRAGTVASGRDPIWCHFHVHYRRDLPKGQIKGAFVKSWTVGSRRFFDLGIIVKCDEVAAPVHPRPEHAVAIDLGWRRVATGTRLAYWVGTDGAEGSLVIQDDVSQRQDKSASLHSIRELRTNAFREQLVAARDELVSIWPVLADTLSHCHLWLKKGRFALLQREWALMSPRPETHPVFEALGAFLKQDRHLWNWEANNLVRMKNQIESRATQLAHELAKRYGTIVVEDIDLAELQQDESAARINSRQITKFGPGVVLDAVKKAVGKHGTRHVVRNAAYTTRDCSTCGHRRDFPQGATAALELACDACGVIEDQDRTAAKNLLVGWDQEGDGRAKATRAIRTRQNRKRAKEVPSPTP